MDDKKIKEEIIEKMKKYNISYRMLARELYISHGYLYDMLHGRRKLGEFYIQKINKLLK